MRRAISASHSKATVSSPPPSHVDRKLTKLSEKSGIDTGFLDDSSPRLPLLITCSKANIEFFDWLKHSKAILEDCLTVYGGLLFRGFGVRDVSAFQMFLSVMIPNLVDYHEKASPRTRVCGSVYTSTEYPPNERIALHNELSYVTNWPKRIAFCCETPASQDGETPIADTRGVLSRIPRQIRSEFEKRGWLLVRNYGTGLGPGWQEAFGIRDRSELKSYCNRANIRLEWQGDNLKTHHLRPAITRHDLSNEEVWFNHVSFWHVSNLAPDVQIALSEILGSSTNFPYSTYFGDGGEISPAVIAEIRNAYDEETVEFRWHSGDVLLLDNTLVAHGRNRFEGPRRILAAMGGP